VAAGVLAGGIRANAKNCRQRLALGFIDLFLGFYLFEYTAALLRCVMLLFDFKESDYTGLSY
jgi:hypothetical protein